jgi:hypothetical protein
MIVRSRAGKLEEAQHHSRIVKRKGRKKRIERGFFLCILFWKSSVSFTGVTQNMSH